MNNEDKIKFGKLRGGRATKVIKDKTKYDRKKDKSKTKKEIAKWKTGQENL